MIIPQKSTNNPFWTPAGDLPVLRHAGVVLTDFNSIARHLRACNYSADYNLPPKQVEKSILDQSFKVINSKVAEASAFIQLMDEKLAPALRLTFDHFGNGDQVSVLGTSSGLTQRIMWK